MTPAPLAVRYFWIAGTQHGRPFLSSGIFASFVEIMTAISLIWTDTTLIETTDFCRSILSFSLLLHSLQMGWARFRISVKWFEGLTASRGYLDLAFRKLFNRR